MTTAAFALLLLAGTAPAALAQPQDQGERPHEHGGGERPTRPHGEAHDRAVQGGQPGWRQAAPPSAPAAAPQQVRPTPTAPAGQDPRAARFQGGGGRWGGPPPGEAAGRPGGERRGGDGQGFQGRPFQGQPGQPPQGQPPQGQPPQGQPLRGRPDRWVGRDGGDRGPPQFPGGRADHQDRRDFGEGRRYYGAPNGRWEGDRRSADGPRDGGRWAGQGGGDWNRGDWRGRPQWRPGAYPHSFASAHRYRVAPYVRPPHYYARVWSFGEYLPATWFAPDYLIEDWWNYDLPAPPPGFDWVRVGDDALLVDEYSGQIVQVIRELFW